ncbi:MAG: AAA family ATPase, partial [Chloroflexaceae bacterium]|nr:AAA family ATPase [Chloroflexaceae bacterium]
MLNTNSTARITLLTAPAASGKTTTICETLAARRWRRVWIIVPDRWQQQTMRDRLAHQGRVRVQTWVSLAGLVLRHAGVPGKIISPIGRRYLVRKLMHELADHGQLPALATVARKPGFADAVASLITEASEQKIPPDRLAQARVSPYDAEFARIYQTYLERLAQWQLVDPPRQLSRACDIVQHTPQLVESVQLLIVDGFDQLTPLQLDLLTAMSQQVGQTIVTLTGSSDQPQRLAHHRFRRTYEQLVAVLKPAVVSQPTRSTLPAPLAHIEAHLFALTPPAAVAAQGCVQLVEAADREREVRAALRHIHRLLTQGVAPSSIALLLRNEAPYLALLREIATEYQLPLRITSGQALVESPPITALLVLLRLPVDDYPVRNLAEVWRSIADGRLQVSFQLSGTFDLNQAARMLLQQARDAGITFGLRRLRTLLERQSQHPPGASRPADEDGGEGTDRTTPDDLAQLLTLLNGFAAWLQPPAKATAMAYSQWLEQQVTLPDVSPWSAFNTGWKNLIADITDISKLLAEPAQRYRAWLDDLTLMLQHGQSSETGTDGHQVTVLSVTNARGRTFDHVVLMGLSEGEFPPRLPRPTLYSLRERALLQQQGIHLLWRDPADERSRFYDALARARKSLLLTRTYLDEQGNPLDRSPYLEAVLSLVQLAPAEQTRLR